jgi:hypothetical protein
MRVELWANHNGIKLRRERLREQVGNTLVGGEPQGNMMTTFWEHIGNKEEKPKK